MRRPFMDIFRSDARRCAPAASESWPMLRYPIHAAIIVTLTLLTQLGGVAWLAALGFRRRLIAFVVAYVILVVSAVWIAPTFGRVALSCGGDGPLRVGAWIYCALNRNYVTPETAEMLFDTAAAVDARFPGTTTLVLDAGFPFVTGFPLLPHLSHDDGQKADLAFYYRDAAGYLPGAMRSPVGYFAFEEGTTACASVWPTLRWNLGMLQPLWPKHALDEARTRFLLAQLARDRRVTKILLEPHLKARMRLSAEKIRFQGCRAARHDDHIHIQL